MIIFNKVVCAVLIVYTTLNINAQALRFQTFSDDSTRSWGNRVIQRNANDYIFSVGSSNYSNNQMIDAFLLNTDSLLNIKWFKKYDIDTTDTLYTVNQFAIKTMNNGVLLGGGLSTHPLILGYLLNVDSNGKLKWAKKYNCGFLQPIREYSDGTILISSIGTFWPSDAVIAKLDSNGNILWAKYYGDKTREYLYDGIPTNDGGVIVTGYSDFKPYVLKVDTSGTIEWQKTFIDSANLYNAFYTIAQTPDSGFVFTLYSSTPYTQGIIKLSKNGAIEWVKQYVTSTNDNRSSVFAKLIALPNGDIISIGMIFKDHTWENIYSPTLLCTDHQGNIKWHRQYDQFDPKISTQLNDLLQMQDKGFMIVGLTAQLPLKEHLYIVKTDSMGHTGCENDKDIETWTKDLYFNVIDGDSVRDFALKGEDYPVFVSDVDMKFNTICGINVSIEEQLSVKNEKLSIYPNPVTTTATIEINTEKAINNWQFALYNLFGEQVMEINDINTNRISISRAGLSNGLYFYKVSTEQQQEVGKGKVLIVD